VKFGIRYFYENVSKKCKYVRNWAKVSGTSHDELSTFHFCRRSQIAIKASSSRKTVSSCKDSREGIDKTLRHHSITLHVHFLPFFYTIKSACSCTNLAPFWQFRYFPTRIDY